MSLTRSAAVLGSIHEDALNDLLQAFFSARPRYRHYGSPAFVPATTVAETRVDAIQFPGIAGGIQWRVRFEVPRIDLHDPSVPLPPPLVLHPGQFSLRTEVEICLDCVRSKDDRKPPTGRDDKERPPPKPDHVVCTRLGVYGTGHIDAWTDAAGNGEVRLRVDEIEIVDITPDSLESLLECLLRMLLDAALKAVVLPLQALRAGAFRLVVSDGPRIESDRILAFGNV